MYASAQPLDFLARTKNASFPNPKLLVSHPGFPDGHELDNFIFNGSESIQDRSNSHSISSERERNRIAWLSLKLVPGLGNRSILRLLEVFGSAERVLAAGLRDLCETGLTRDKPLHALAAKQFLRDPQTEWTYLKSKNFRLICIGDDEYPANLVKIPDPPAVLFALGELLPRDLVSIAVVGSRYASPAGIIFAERLSSDMAFSGLTVVSGLAHGIDSAAHRGALKAGGRTLAVLGCGIDVNYPSANADLRQEIARAGALLTEFLPGAPPSSGNFPSRNRIISGLSLGVVVVEAAERSGSLITARFALEQGREVFAVPGVAQSMRSKGTHRLIKEGAKLIEGVEDILEEIRPLIRPVQSGRSRAVTSPPFSKGGQGGFEKAQPGMEKPPSPAETISSSLFIEGPHSPEETNLLRIVDKIPKHIDEIAQQANMPVQHAAAILLELELRGVVSQLPGKYFIIN
ncbi:MAG: DNA-processing protein DprA [Syntrophobacteraceae bacterium]